VQNISGISAGAVFNRGAIVFFVGFQDKKYRSKEE
jgi:hypothetical protein